MKQKMLFYAPNDFDIDLSIFNQLSKITEYDIVKLRSKKYQYKNVFERIQNFFVKTFLRKNLKEEWLTKIQIEQINAHNSFDLCFIIRPDLLGRKILDKIKNTIPIRKAVYWDSFKKIRDSENTLLFFNEHFSFEKEDCIKFHLKPITNFYIHKASSIIIPEYDAFFFGAKDSRFEKIKTLFEYLYKKGWKAKGLLVGKKTKINNNIFLEITQHRIPFSECYTFSENTKIVVDICHPDQEGLSIRPFEAIGLKRKLITNNLNIKNYDFYNENNIFIINDFENLDIPNSFLNTPFEELPQNIYEKYHISNWLKNILN